MFYPNKEAALNFIVSDCGLACDPWVARCGTCWSRSGLRAHSQEWVLLSVGLHSRGAQSACYRAIASAASNYLRRDGGGRGVWVTTNWPDKGRLPATGGKLMNLTAFGLHENEVAASGATNGTGWDVFDLGALDLNSTSSSAGLRRNSAAGRASAGTRSTTVPLRACGV